MVSNAVKRVAAINDMSGFSRCSLTVAMPIIAAMGLHCCPLPTAILSNNTEHSEFFFDDYTDKMQPYADYWRDLKIKFDCIYSGFLGSEKQIDIVKKFISDFKTDKNIVLIDPVMADNGRIYSTYNAKMCEKMKILTQFADIVTPNVTEACILSETQYAGENISLKTAEMMCAKIIGHGAKAVVITGIRDEGNVVNFVCAKDFCDFVKIKAAPVYYSGTGDVFASVLCGAVTNGSSIMDAVKISSDFVEKCVLYSQKCGIYPNEGVAFERFLGDLVNFTKRNEEQ